MNIYYFKTCIAEVPMFAFAKSERVHIWKPDIQTWIKGSRPIYRNNGSFSDLNAYVPYTYIHELQHSFEDEIKRIVEKLNTNKGYLTVGLIIHSKSKHDKELLGFNVIHDTRYPITYNPLCRHEYYDKLPSILSKELKKEATRSKNEYFEMIKKFNLPMKI